MTRDPHGTPPMGGESTDVAQKEGAEVAEDAKRQAQATAGTAKQEAGHVVEEAKRQARDLAHDAREQLHGQARTQTDHLGEALDRFGGDLHALAEGRAEEAGAVTDYADRLANQVDDLAVRIQHLGFDGIVDEVQGFARRRPGAFLAGSFVAGFVVSRLARGAKDAEDGPEGGSASDTAGATDRPATGTPTRTATGDTSTPDVPPPPPAAPATPAAGDAGLTDRPDPLSAGRRRP